MDELGWEGDDMESAPSSVNKEFAKIECWMQGTRDYIKYLKRGYGRVTQLVNFEVRNNKMTTEEAWDWIQKYDGRKPQSLGIFLNYIGITEKEFFEIVKDFVIPPVDPDFENIPFAEKPHDIDEWYRESNTRK